MNETMNILRDYKEAMEANDLLRMAELINAMKKVDPVFVELMINSIEPEDDDEEDEDDE